MCKIILIKECCCCMMMHDKNDRDLSGSAGAMVLRINCTICVCDHDWKNNMPIFVCTLGCYSTYHLIFLKSRKSCSGSCPMSQ